MIYSCIQALIDYAINTALIKKTDERFMKNKICEALSLAQWCQPTEKELADAEKLSFVDAMNGILDYATQNKLLVDDGITGRDLFDTKIMGLLTPRPSEVLDKFWGLYDVNPQLATDYYYKLSQDTNYIRRDRIVKDQKWVTPTEYGEMEITVNLSKPEKDPKAIAAALNNKQSGYPKCLLCAENEGFAGNLSHPARQNHRLIDLDITDEKWCLQYSPYVYYNEHCIVLNSEHTPMKIDEKAFGKLFGFVKLFPHYFVGSNADLPIVGGSILTHEHFQGGNHTFAMAQAEKEKVYKLDGFANVEIARVKWPMSVLRISGDDDGQIVKAAGKILSAWRNYTDEKAGVFAETNGEKHNTVTPIARKVNGVFELDLVLRNNITSAEFPDGVFHPHAQLHHIKKENIGLIEVMGLAVLPARLKDEMKKLAQAMTAGDTFDKNIILK
ncbi:MAG: UDP-glucose--hexose-1-phosphate uridylyltransferase, partial [Oscillospiraceae bacterium]